MRNIANILFISLAFFSWIVPGAALSFENYTAGGYVSIISGAGFADQEEISSVRARLQIGYLCAVSLGYNTIYNIRVEGEVAYRNHHVRELNVHLEDFNSFSQPAHGHFHTFSYMANVIYDVPVPYWFRPYCGAGVGFAHHLSRIRVEQIGEILKTSRTKNGFVWQVIGGIAFSLTPCLDFNVEYRFYKPNVDLFNEQDVIAGLRYTY